MGQVNKNGIPISNDCNRTNRKTSPTCKKDAYPSESAARAVAIVRQLQGVLRAYKCIPCTRQAKHGGEIWHLTKFDKETNQPQWDTANGFENYPHRMYEDNKRK